ncbi:MAG: Spy/CpxP family protein refolding chaperone [Cyanobacteria bacterium J06627_3]
MKFLTIKQCLGGALMLTALVATPAILKAGSANAFSPERAEELNITPEQQTELDAIKDNARTQVEAILTDDQLAELAGTTGRERRQAMRNLNLSEDQRAQMRSIRETSRAAAEDVFTAEQQAQLQAMAAERGERQKNRREELAEELNLTSQQQAELDAIKESAQTQIDAVLTSDQRAALEGKTGRERVQAMRNLDLSEDQRTQLQSIREESRAAADEVLTAEQLAQLEEMRENRGNRRQR